ncbi:hypothetical protein GQ457_09G027170 [Hibiscus cannabinus]
MRIAFSAKQNLLKNLEGNVYFNLLLLLLPFTVSLRKLSVTTVVRPLLRRTSRRLPRRSSPHLTCSLILTPVVTCTSGHHLPPPFSRRSLLYTPVSSLSVVPFLFPSSSLLLLPLCADLYSLHLPLSPSF